MTGALGVRLRQIAERIDALSVRERVLVFGAAVVVILFAVNALLFSPLRIEQGRLERSFKDKLNQTQALETQLETLLANLTRDPDAENQARLDGLRARIKQMDEELGRVVAGFVSPRDMAKLVEQALSKGRGLEFVKVENLPPTPVVGGAKDDTQAEHAVYKHGLRIEMKGGYRDIVNYLRALEALPWKVFWGEVVLETENHPVSRVTVVIYTLSRTRGWIST